MTDPSLYPEPQENAITFWGHACAYIDVDGFGLVTDPVFSPRYATIRRRLIPAPPSSSYDRTRVVLLSHAHHDHLDPATLARFPAEALILAPAPAVRYLKRRGLHARVMRPGMEASFPGGSIVAVASHHPGGRHSLKARADGGALGYVIRTSSSTIYYSGDTEYFSGFSTIGDRFDPDIAIMNINAHLRFPEAASAILDLGMPIVLPIHCGAYGGKSVRHGPRWREELEEALGSIVVPLEVGEAFALPATPRAPGRVIPRRRAHAGR
jgi:L-ascorbate metabolism protein UlaG (beta-lactamase superfamily)